MEVRTGSIDFSAPLRGSGPRSFAQTVVFARQVTTAVAGLNGYTIGFVGDDHHVGQMQIRLNTTVNANTVTVEAILGLRDWSGDWDDNYNGTVDFTLVADLATVTSAPPRPDLLVTGMEFNQAVQFFRADSYLDPAHVQPDNSIWMVARKNTGIRVYTDWDPGAGLPAITRLTGQLTVQTGSTVLTLNPINSGGVIMPVRDAQINMAIADNTLNFMIPAAWCVGSITVSGELWDADSPAGHSAKYTRTIVFTEVESLNLYLVGINYQAVAPALPAPTQAAISSALGQLIKTYPVGDVIQTGYATLDFSETVTGNLASGCGDGFNDLLDSLDDLRGSSDDIYLGILPAGVVNTPGNSVGGCAPQGGKTAATFVDEQADVPHEIGHALDRRHAPCNTGCDVAPANVDPNYPQYGSFRSDSIGVFGFDPATNTVFNPSLNSDFMAYHFPQWVSAYTYNGLRGSSFGPSGGGSAGGGSPHYQEGVDFSIIFLGLTISRDRKVTRRPSFNFYGSLLNRKRCGDFVVEFQDDKRQPLGCSPLHCNCDEGCNCWPKNIRDVVFFPVNSRWMVIWEDDKQLYEEEIPPVPKVEIVSASSGQDGVMLEWNASAEKGQLTYLVHWYDDKAEEWRGVAARQQDNKLLIPKRLFARSKEMKVRVLATPGLGTGTAEATISYDQYKPQSPRSMLLGYAASDQPVQLPGVLNAATVDAAGRQIAGDSMAWYGTNGLIGRGPGIDLRSLAPGRQTIRLVVRGDQPIQTSTYMIERNSNGFFLYGSTCDPKPGPTEPPHVHPHPRPDDPCND